MENSPVDLSDVTQQFPRASAYDLQWIMENQMGPNVLWLAEALSQVMDLKPGMQAQVFPIYSEAHALPFADEFFDWDFCSFHSPDWWRRHWEKTGNLDVEHADSIPQGWKYWLKWQELLLQNGFPYDAKETELLRQDAGRSLGFTRLVARKHP